MENQEVVQFNLDIHFDETFGECRSQGGAR